MYICYLFLFRVCHLPTSNHHPCIAQIQAHLLSQYHTLPPSLILPHLLHLPLHLPTPRLMEMGERKKRKRGRKEAVRRSGLPTTLSIQKVHVCVKHQILIRREHFSVNISSQMQLLWRRWEKRSLAQGWTRALSWLIWQLTKQPYMKLTNSCS